MPVREHYSHIKADKRNVEKRKEAEARAVIRATRSDEQQLQRLDALGYRASKEKKRLRARINRRREK